MYMRKYISVVAAVFVCASIGGWISSQIDRKWWERPSSVCEILGESIQLPTPIFFREFWFDNGDGYAIHKFELSKELATRICDGCINSRGFPSKDRFYGDWHIEEWRQAPPKDADEMFINHSLSFSISEARDAKRFREVSAMADEISDALGVNTTCFAFVYRATTTIGGEPRIKDINLYVIDAQQGFVYVIFNYT